MAEDVNEIKEPTGWEKFKAGFKKAFPWLCGAGAAIGTGVLVHRMDKWSTQYDYDLEEARHIKKYVEEAKNDVPRVFHIENESDDIWAKMVICEKPEWADTVQPETNMLVIDEVEKVVLK